MNRIDDIFTQVVSERQRKERFEAQVQAWHDIHQLYDRIKYARGTHRNLLLDQYFQKDKQYYTTYHTKFNPLRKPGVFA